MVMHHRLVSLRGAFVGALAAFFAAVPALAQTRPADTGPAGAALKAAESEFAARKSKLKDDDVPGRINLAYWAREREMWPQAAQVAHEALDRDPDNRSAWTVLQQVDQAVNMPAEPAVEDELKREFNRRFERTAGATTAFKTRNSRHFLLCYDTSDAFAAQRGGSLEKAYEAFMFFFNMQKLRPAFLQKRLVVILFKNRADYLAYAKATEGADLSWAAGYYSQRTNRAAFFDDTNGPEAESVEKKLDKLRARLKELNVEIDTANNKGDHDRARGLATERDAIGNALYQVNTRVDNTLGLMNAVKTVHEAAHQLAFNTGIQKRLVDYPLWFSEGLACSFEIEDRSGRRGPSIVNYGRLAVCKEAVKRDKMIPLEKFISQPQPPAMDEATLNVFYAEGWALFHYLYKTNRPGMEKYLLAYQAVPSVQAVPPERRLKLFTDAFGEDLPPSKPSSPPTSRTFLPRPPSVA